MNKIIIGGLWILSLIIAYFLGDYVGFVDTVVAPSAHGRFVADPEVKLLPERDLQLLNDLIYIDPDEQPWLAPKGSVANGASIPRLFWSMVGGPLSGKYRNASIVHDVECVRRKNRWPDVHLMFYHACLAGGVPDREAKRLYWAVARFGPRWRAESRTRMITSSGPDGVPYQTEEVYTVTVPIKPAEPTPQDVEWANKFFQENDPSVDAIPDIEPGTGAVPQ